MAPPTTTAPASRIHLQGSLAGQGQHRCRHLETVGQTAWPGRCCGASWACLSHQHSGSCTPPWPAPAGHRSCSSPLGQRGCVTRPVAVRLLATPHLRLLASLRCRVVLRHHPQKAAPQVRARQRSHGGWRAVKGAHAGRCCCHPALRRMQQPCSARTFTAKHRAVTDKPCPPLRAHAHLTAVLKAHTKNPLLPAPFPTPQPPHPPLSTTNPPPPPHSHLILSTSAFSCLARS